MLALRKRLLHSIHVLGGEIHKVVHSEMIFQHTKGSTESGEQKSSLGIHSSKYLIAWVLFLLKFISFPCSLPPARLQKLYYSDVKITLNYDHKFF